MAQQEREILERAVRTLSEQAAAASAIADGALDASLDGTHSVMLQAKMLRLKLLKVKGDLERELEQLVLDCRDCGRTVHRVARPAWALGAPGTGAPSRTRPVRPSSTPP